MKRPDLKGIPENVVNYIEKIESILIEVEDNGMGQMYKAISKKMRALAEAIDNSKISLDGEDKSFDRLLKTLIESKGIAENLTFLESRLGINQSDDAENKKGRKNILESLIKDSASKKDKQADN